jgi:hypothetical protein
LTGEYMFMDRVIRNLLREANRKDTVHMLENSAILIRHNYTRRLSHVHIKPQERPVMLTNPKRR